MNIIQQGDPKRLDKTMRFTCSACGCIWDANPTEYRREDDRFSILYVCKCPTCGQLSYDGKRMVE